ncbi:MAG: DUF2071 domain-containing protein [Flavobacteriaceae bacterium]
MSFLTAEWRKLAMANYIVPPELLAPYVPIGTELDLWEGKCYVSLVGFMFLNTKLLGVKIPFHSNFEEVNLRFYVKRFDSTGYKRGVVFIKEIVPKPALTWVANTVYKENYETLPMKHRWEISSHQNEITYLWKKNNSWNTFTVITNGVAEPIPSDSEVEFITEHYWGYACKNKSASIEYEVTHPKWEHYPIQEFTIDVDFNKVYGAPFGFLKELQPTSVFLAEGSPITVENKRVIKASY